MSSELYKYLFLRELNPLIAGIHTLYSVSYAKKSKTSFNVENGRTSPLKKANKSFTIYNITVRRLRFITTVI